MFFEPPTLTAEDATAFPAGTDGHTPPTLRLNRATRRQLARRDPAYRAAREQERPFRRAFRGIATSRDRFLMLKAGEALR